MEYKLFFTIYSYIDFYSGGGLHWHDGIPSDELWVKIGGDAGGGTFKMNVQIVNIQCPNSPQNTCVFAIFDAKDTVTNLHVALDRFKDVIEELDGTVLM